tara:strand:+ start:5525 stop:7198 length:1674 start_codon:yes stop_codon:yes gene_type:complete
MPPKFRPKQPKARKAKTSEQKAVIAGRQAKEDRRGDDIKRAQQRSFALRKDPQSFLTGMGDMATAYTTTAMAKVNTTAQADIDAQVEAEFAFGAPPSAPAPAIPPGVIIKTKNANSTIRRQNRSIRGDQYLAENPYDPMNVSAPQPVRADGMAFGREAEQRTKGWMPRPLRPSDSGIGKGAYEPLRSDSFTPQPVEDLYATDITDSQYYKEGAEAREMYGGAGIYHPGGFTPAGVVQGPREDKALLDRYLPEGALVPRDSDGQGVGGISSLAVVQDFQRDTNIVAVNARPAQDQVRVRMDTDAVGEMKVRAKQLLKQLKAATTEEQKYVIKAELDELKQGRDSEEQKGKRRLANEAAESSAPITFGQENLAATMTGIKKYPGPANIQQGILIKSEEVGRRAINPTDDYKWNTSTQGRGGGMTGQTITHSNEMSNYVAPEIKKLKARTNASIPDFGFYGPAEYLDETGERAEGETRGNPYLRGPQDDRAQSVKYRAGLIKAVPDEEDKERERQEKRNKLTQKYAYENRPAPTGEAANFNEAGRRLAPFQSPYEMRYFQ